MTLLRDCDIGVGRKALVVDDEEVVGQVMCAVLQQMGYQVEHALDGDQALTLTRQGSYDVVVCDLLMPRVNGMALYEMWLEEAPGLARHTVFVTGDNLGSETSDFISRTGCRCIYKPFRLADLAEAVVQLERDRVA